MKTRQCAVYPIARASTAQLLAIVGRRAASQGLFWGFSGAVHGLLVLLTLLIVMAGRVIEPVAAQQAVLVDLPVREPVQQVAQRVECPVAVSLDMSEVFYTPYVVSEAREDGDDSATSYPTADLNDIPSPALGTIGFVGRHRTGPPTAKAKAVGANLYTNRTGRVSAAAKYGGSAESEAAVDLGLAWLAKTQNLNGSWSLFSTEKHDVKDHKQLAESALATLAFLSAGYTEKHGHYKDRVGNALDYLMARQRPDGGFVKEHRALEEPTYLRTELDRREWRTAHPQPEVNGYAQAICGMALAEAWGMSRGKTHDAAQRAVNYSVNVHQASTGSTYGGWRYKARTHLADTSVTGWFILQLKSARASGLTVPGHGWQGAEAYMESVTCTAGGYGTQGGVAYQPPGGQFGNEHVARPAMTAVGLCAWQFLGKARGDPRVLGAARQVSTMAPMFLQQRSIYGIYYGTIGMFQFGSDLWPIWNAGFRDPLVARQEKDGELAGSWWGDQDGDRTYLTAMAVLSLEVYYRYLPMYDENP